MNPNDLLTAHEAASYLRTTYKGFDMWVRRHHVPCERYGRKRLFRRATLDRVLRLMSDPTYRQSTQQRKAS